VSPNEEDTAANAPEIPAKYGAADQSGLMIKVVANEKNVLELDLSSK
jgi:hypothetical protein